MRPSSTTAVRHPHPPADDADAKVEPVTRVGPPTPTGAAAKRAEDTSGEGRA